MNALNITSLRKSLGMNQKEFGDKIGIAQSYFSEIERGKKPLLEDLYNNIVRLFGDDVVSQHSSDNIAIGDNNKSFGSIGNNSKSTLNNVGNTVSVTMPESGTQKIIKPTGEVEIHRLDPSDKSNSEELDRLKQRIQDLERIIAEKDVTIQSKEATIQSKDDTIKSKDELISFLRADRQ